MTYSDVVLSQEFTSAVRGALDAASGGNGYVRVANFGAIKAETTFGDSFDSTVNFTLSLCAQSLDAGPPPCSMCGSPLLHMPLILDGKPVCSKCFCTAKGGSFYVED